MTAPSVVKELIERFKAYEETYHCGRYNETQLREEFLNPFFEALGWDIFNRKGYADAYKEVIHEDAIKIGGRTKAPDYCFRAGGGMRSFFVEAKKPSVDIREAVSPAYQLRRYAWSAKLPVSILTDFEEFAVYDCRIRPDKNDKAATARVIYLNYTEYVERWDELYGLFSPDAIRKGSLERFVTSKKVKKGTAEVDKAFLDEIESWRDELARNLALRNDGLSQRDLNFAVQRIIDRIIFLRICEDRGVEPYGTLQTLQNAPNIYSRLSELFQRADDRYNSGLFHFTAEKDRSEPPDELTLELTVDDKPLKDIFRDLYFPDSPYEFSVFPAEILGQVYEQFLGKVIRLTKGHQAKVEEKPEVRKAGGVYYTPAYIVDYIVQHTVGKLLEGSKTTLKVVPHEESKTTLKVVLQASKLRILDPACGSGSFLLGAYQYLLDWHRDRYIEDDAEKHARGRNPKLYRGPAGDWRLTSAERKRILLNNIYGVDIDPQAVEVTKLSLLLKVLEGESAETISNQLCLFHQRALPDLGANIKCGNSLIGPDFYEGRQLNMFDDEDRYRINAFDWKAEFPQVFKSGGFDTVIGNPPYIRVRLFKELYPKQVEYLESRYCCASHVWDIYLLFFERAIQLARMDGRISFIVPIQTLHQPNCESLRRLLLSNSTICSIADLSRLRVFEGAIVKNCILVCERGEQTKGMISTFLPLVPDQLFGKAQNKWPVSKVLKNPGLSFKLDLLSPKKDLCEKLKSKSWQLDELCYVTFGLRSCAKGRGRGGKDRLITSDRNAINAKPYLEGREIKRYILIPTGHFIKYIPEEMYSPRTPALFECKKIVSQSMLSRMRIVATLDEDGYYVEQSLVCIVPHTDLSGRTASANVPLEFILGTMNSRVGSFYFATYIIDYSLGGGLVHATPGSQGKLLVPKASKSQIRSMVSLVESMLALHKKLAVGRLSKSSQAGHENTAGRLGKSSYTGHDKTLIERQITATDRQIDQLVYELYGLTDAEIAIVEESTI